MFLCVYVYLLLGCACASKMLPDVAVLLGRPRIKLIAYLSRPNKKKMC